MVEIAVAEPAVVEPAVVEPVVVEPSAVEPTMGDAPFFKGHETSRLNESSIQISQPLAVL